jgi:hypothetical protein
MILIGQVVGQTSFTWYFGTQAGIKFNPDGSTIPATGSYMSTSEGCTVMADTAGIIMFYSDGLSVWNNSSSTPVCTTLPGGQSSTQAALAIAIPGSNCQRFLIFTTKGNEQSGTHDLGVALINVAGIAPNYAVTVSEPPLSVLQPPGVVVFGEKLAATSDTTGGCWVVAHDYITGSETANTFYKYHITSAAFGSVTTTAQAQAVLMSIQQTQSIGSSHNNLTPPGFNAQGQMKFSKTGQKLGLVLAGSKTIDLFHFDLTTGYITTIATTNVTPSNGNLYGCEFSPDGNVLYTSEGFASSGTTIRKLHQWDISGGILSNPYIVSSGSNQFSNRYKYNALQLGPNDKIYCSEEIGISFLSVIGNPNNTGSACGWSSMSEPIAGTNTLGLPTVISNFPCSCLLDSPVGHGSSRCGEGTVILHATVLPTQTVDWYATATGGTPLLAGDTTFVTPVINATTTYFAEARNTSANCLSPIRTPVVATILPAPFPAIAGPDTVCTGTSDNVYLTEPGMTNYTWTVSAGGAITNGQGTDAITVIWNITGVQTVSVNYTDASGCTAVAPSFYIVTVNPLPVPTISGPASSCIGMSGNTYTTESGMAGYDWTVSSGGIITGGTGTNTITVTWTMAGTQSVGVSYTDTYGCPALSPTVYEIMVSPLPVPVISGPGSTCTGSTGNVYATEQGMTGYAWTVSAGGIITNGYGTNEITITWITSGAQIISVNYTDTSECAAAAPATYNVMVYPLPDPAGIINGISPVCAGTMAVIYEITQVANAMTYLWSVPQGVNLIAGQGTRSITVDFADNATSGNFTVYASNLCGNGLPSPPFPVIVNQPAVANAGEDLVTCESLPVTLSGSNAVNYYSVLWTTSGTGTFDDPAKLHPAYTPGTDDVLNGSVTLTFTAIAAEPCQADTDHLILAICRQAMVEAGADKALCERQQYTLSDADAQNYSSLVWSTSGTGSFSDLHALHPVYLPGEGDFLNGKVLLILTATSASPCFPASDTVIISFIKPPVVQAGPGGSVCQDVPFQVTGT